MKKQRKKKNNAQNADKEIKVNTHFYTHFARRTRQFSVASRLTSSRTTRQLCAVSLLYTNSTAFLYPRFVEHSMEWSLFSWEESKWNSNLFATISSTIFTLCWLARWFAVEFVQCGPGTLLLCHATTSPLLVNKTLLLPPCFYKLKVSKLFK